MTVRLVLGCGTIGQTIVSRLADQRGRLVVADDDENAVKALREEGVSATVADLTDPAALAELVDAPAVVAVAPADGSTTAAVTRAAREAFSDAQIVVCPDPGTESDFDGPIERLADRVVRPLAATTEFVLNRVGNAGLRTRKLTGLLRRIEEPLAIVTHDNPDPDAIASAVALDRIATAVGCATEICYFGSITHQENRAFVNLLEYDLTNLASDADLSEYGGIALVDHSQPGVNDGLPEGTPVDVVIDHHPPRMPVEARFVDLRSAVGATSTLLVDYFRGLDVTPSEAVATGLLFGIHVDTSAFTREVCPADFEAAAFLQPHADLGTLERIESPSMTPETLETIARAITNRERHGPVLVSGVGQLSDRDALAQAADRLLTLEDVTTTFVYGLLDGTVYVSARARGAEIDLGETLREAFGQIGDAGGHADMAGAQISLGLLEAIETEDESLTDVVSTIVSERFLDAVDSRTNRIIRDVYPDEFHAVDDVDPEALALDDADQEGDGQEGDGQEGDGQEGDDGASDPDE